MVDVPPIMRDRHYPKRSASRMPLQEFPSNDPPTGTGVESQFVGRTGFAGHLCAAGCGHYCWLWRKAVELQGIICVDQRLLVIICRIPTLGEWCQIDFLIAGAAAMSWGCIPCHSTHWSVPLVTQSSKIDFIEFVTSRDTFKLPWMTDWSWRSIGTSAMETMVNLWACMIPQAPLYMIDLAWSDIVQLQSGHDMSRLCWSHVFSDWFIPTMLCRV